MTYVVKVKHGALGDIVVDVTTDPYMAEVIKKEIPDSWIEEIDHEGEV